jgi:hypothetical protein
MPPSMRDILSLLSDMQRAKAVDILQWEVTELRQVFALLVAGQAVGFPAPPAELTLALLPEMGEELQLLMNHLATAHSPISQLYSSLPVD